MRQMMSHSHMAAAANAEAMFSCAHIALILDTMVLVSIFVILVSQISLISLISLLAIISIIVLKNFAIPKDLHRFFG